ncbi:MAG: hypothetical protein ACI8Z5_002792, partial [Lentimonas sp.]
SANEEFGRTQQIDGRYDLGRAVSVSGLINRK